MSEPFSYITARPYLPVSDVERSIEFFEKALGLVLLTKYGEPTNFAIVQLGGASITLFLNQTTTGSGTTFVVATGVDVIYERCRAANAELDSDLADRPYGMRDFTVHDPDGNHIIVGQRI